MAPSGPKHLVKVTYTHVLWGRLTLSIHWACYWYGKLGHLSKSNPVNEVGKNQRLRTVGFRIARAVGVLTPQSFPRTRMRLTEMVCCSGGGSGSTYCVSRHEKPRFTEKWARSYRESDPASICGLLGQRPATKAKCHLRINHTTVHLPGGTVQQGYKCDSSLRASKPVTFWSR